LSLYPYGLDRRTSYYRKKEVEGEGVKRSTGGRNEDRLEKNQTKIQGGRKRSSLLRMGETKSEKEDKKGVAAYLGYYQIRTARENSRKYVKPSS